MNYDKTKLVEYRINLEAMTEKAKGFMGRVIKEEGWKFDEAKGMRDEGALQNIKRFVNKGNVIETFWHRDEQKEKWRAVDVSFLKKEGSLKDLLFQEKKDFIMVGNMLEKYATKHLSEDLTKLKKGYEVDLKDFFEKRNLDNEAEATKYQRVNYERFENNFIAKEVNLKEVAVNVYGMKPTEFKSGNNSDMTIDEKRGHVKKAGNIVDFLEGTTKAQWSEEAGVKMENLLASDTTKSEQERDLLIGRLSTSKGAYMARSPFDMKNNNSFITISAGGKFFADSTGKTGDIITFVQETQKIDFKEAIELLMDKYKPAKAMKVGKEQINADMPKVYYVKGDDKLLIQKNSESGRYSFINYNNKLMKKYEEEFKADNLPLDDLKKKVVDQLRGNLPELVQMMEPTLNGAQLQTRIIDIVSERLDSDKKKDFIALAEGREGYQEAMQVKTTLLGRVNNGPAIVSGMDAITEKFGVKIEDTKDISRASAGTVAELQERESKMNLA